MDSSKKQVAREKEFAFKIYLAYDPRSPPSRPFALNASIFLFFDWVWVEGLRKRCFEGGGRRGLSLYIY